MITFNVEGNIITALKQFAAQKDVRYYLNGIAVETRGKDVFMVATDGLIMGCCRLVVYNPLPESKIIIPNELLKTIKPKNSVEIKYDENFDSNAKPITITQAGISIQGMTIDGVYPNWRSYMPERISNEMRQYNAGLISRLYKAAQSLEVELISIGHNGDNPALVNYEIPYFFALIMPLRVDAIEVLESPPDWAKEHEHE